MNKEMGTNLHDPPGAWSRCLELVGGVEGSVVVPVILIMRLPLLTGTRH